MRIKMLIASAGVCAAMLATPASAQADEQGFIDTLTYQYGWVIWDYPELVTQGYVACGLLYRDVNPMGWLTTVPQYDPGSAAQIIMAAKLTMCPDAAVTL